jgi:hypothetical protein
VEALFHISPRLTTYNVVVVVAGERKKELNYRVLFFLFAD